MVPPPVSSVQWALVTKIVGDRSVPVHVGIAPSSGKSGNSARSAPTASCSVSGWPLVMALPGDASVAAQRAEASKSIVRVSVATDRNVGRGAEGLEIRRCSVRGITIAREYEYLIGRGDRGAERSLSVRERLPGMRARASIRAEGSQPQPRARL
jgi:hypothetical protein